MLLTLAPFITRCISPPSDFFVVVVFIKSHTWLLRFAVVLEVTDHKVSMLLVMCHFSPLMQKKKKKSKRLRGRQLVEKNAYRMICSNKSNWMEWFVWRAVIDGSGENVTTAAASLPVNMFSSWKGSELLCIIVNGHNTHSFYSEYFASFRGSKMVWATQQCREVIMKK